ncbi:oligosaccharide flippase family protein [Peribacillus psychrosaccharolyticus]|uniref:oligosaccharide flippase family protein n=1 Tax=Peribacillus psychrosaccharolyticus TaxID=1407 RepID=UPI003D2C157B
MSTSDVKKGIISSYGILAADIVSGIIFTPFLIRSLGQSEYGIYSLIGAFVASLTILDFGFGNAITRYIAQYRAEERKDKESNFLAMCLIIYLGIAVATFLVGLCVLTYFDDIYKSTFMDKELSLATTMFIIMLVNLSFSFFIGTFNAYIQGYEKYPVLNLISFARLFCRLFVLIILLTLGYKSIAVVAVDTLLNIISGCIYFVYATNRLHMKIKLINFDFKLLKEISKYSSFVFIGNITDMLYWRMGLLILGAVSGAKSVAVYAIGITLVSYFQYISGVINGKLFPLITRMVVQRANNVELTAFCSRIGRIQFMLLGGILIGFYSFGSEFIDLWVGEDYSLSWNIGIILMGVMLVQAIQYPFVLILRAKKKDGLRTIIQLVAMVLGSVIGFLLVQKLGLIGMTLGLALATLLLNFVVLNIYYINVLGLNIILFFGLLARLVPCMGAAYIAGVLINIMPGYAWGTFILKCMIFLFVYFVFLWFIGTNESEKALILNLKRRFIIEKTQGV